MLSLLARPAFYYYKTEANKTSEQTLVDVQKNAEAQGVPYSYVLLDHATQPDVVSAHELQRRTLPFRDGHSYEEVNRHSMTVEMHRVKSANGLGEHNDTLKK